MKMDGDISTGQFLVYQAKNGNIKIDVKLADETVWLTQEQMAILFGKGRSTITEHIQNIFIEGELTESEVCRKFRHTTQHGAIKGKTQHKEVNYYNLDVIISVGYRVKSFQGTQFRKWATQRIKEYIIKGFALDDDRLKQEGVHSRYFDELLQRIRDIRSSERNFYQKITDIYATSIDYQKDAEVTRKFFATVQNKMHFAVHGKTAAELISERVDAEKDWMGLTNFEGKYITTRDIGIAKNYLTEAELKQLNLIVSLYLDFAELQATNQRLMKMDDWVEKLDSFLKLSEKQVLPDAGKISHQQAIEKANEEYVKFRHNEDKNYISDFDREIKKLLNKKD
ncbi:MAG TPA: virulence RhuM family protein [Candidatus Cloacimonadota bacterium]|nr:virulence RhuM family protein [Candidatus Cloacimonadota bacterium]